MDTDNKEYPSVGKRLTSLWENVEEWTRYAAEMLKFHGYKVDFDVGEPIEYWVCLDGLFIPTSWRQGLGEACIDVGEPLPFFLERQAQ